MFESVTAERLNTWAEFDSPFRVNEAGRVDRAAGEFAPNVEHDETRDILIDCYAPSESDWEPLTGYTGQYGYNGAVMHSSETLSGRLARDILDTPGVYVVCVVQTYHEDEDGDLVSEPAGWCVLRLRDEADTTGPKYGRTRDCGHREHITYPTSGGFYCETEGQGGYCNFECECDDE